MEPNGAVYVVNRSLCVGSGNGTTVASAKAIVEGLGANQTTSIKTTVHVFEACRENQWWDRAGFLPPVLFRERLHVVTEADQQKKSHVLAGEAGIGRVIRIYIARVSK